MLNLILGTCGTGKTRQIIEKIKERAVQSLESLLLVPEQFTSSAETMIYRELGDYHSGFVTVCSFTSYAERILKTYGGTAIETLTDAGRVVYVRRALDNLADTLPKYHKQKRSFAFCTLCADTIKELKTAGANGASLTQIAGKSKDGEKLYELGLIFSAYDALIENAAMDPADRVSVATEKLPVDNICNLAVFIDNFDGFTAPEYKMLAKLIFAESCTVTLCCDGLSDKDEGLGLFSPVKKTAARLRALAAKRGADVAAPLVLNQDYRHKDAKGLLAVAEFLAYDETEYLPNGDVFISAQRGIYNECKAVAARVKQKAQSGVPYGRMAIICRSLDQYSAAIKYELSLYGVPYFIDEATTMDHSAPAAFFRAALAIAKNGLNTENILRLLKTGLCGFTDEEICALENYAYTWKTGAEDWHSAFTKNPSGFGDMSASDEKLLKIAENARAKCIPPILSFLSQTKNADAANISHSLYYLLDAFCGMQNTLKAAELLRESKSEAAADMLCGTWDGVMGLLSQMELLLKGCSVSVGEYDELFLLLLRSSEVGHVPQAQDSVIVTTADRMRLAEPLICFVMGVSEGEFPKAVGFSGLLTHTDREALVESGIEMPGSFENRCLLEQMFFYRALTAPSKQLYVSYVPAAFGGGAMSAPLARMYKELSCTQEPLSLQQLACTTDAALDLLGMQYSANTVSSATLKEALVRDGSKAQSLAAMESAASEKEFVIDKKGLVREVLGDKLRISPTKIEQYYTCGFAYFLQYVLNVRPRKKAELSPLESGSLVHYILEKALSETKENFIALSAEEITCLAGNIADAYVKENMPDATQRFAYLISRIKCAAAKLLLFLQDEQKQSSFHPVAFEQVIGDGGVEPMRLMTPTGETVNIIGKIDRVDVMEREGKSYIRVIDYKTGEKAFDLDEVYCGLNMQMLLYMFTICKNGKDSFKNAVPAAVLYIQGDPTPKTLDSRYDKGGTVYKLDGLVLDDKAVVQGMDKDASGLFVPFTFKNDGTPKATKKLASLEKLGNIASHVEKLSIEMAAKLYSGQIAARPLVTKKRNPCDVCDYRPVCRHETGVNEACIIAPDKVFEEKPIK
ncbi:MAG: PD-(D/E)XK nuclease family protein [Oscillospiraceae bacterium]